jgi:hypothetical protein
MSTRRRRTAGRQLRVLFEDVPAAAIPRPEARQRLQVSDMNINYHFVNDDTNDMEDAPAELLHRVRAGVKPMATLLLKHQNNIRLTARSVKGAADAFRLKCCFFYARGGRREAVVFQDGAVLRDFYDPVEIIARYRTVGVELDPVLFEVPIESFARAVVFGDMSPYLRLPLTGLCLGYPLDETIQCIRSERGSSAVTS